MLSTTEEIKQHLDLVDLISEYIQLKPAGANFKALCPFHNEKTPSLMVSPEKQIWHCFGCGKGGDIFGFVKEIEGIEFVEALRILADKAGVKIHFAEPKYQTARNILWQLNKELAIFWQKNLWAPAANEKIRNYLKERGLNESTLKFFQIGYAEDDWHQAVNFLRSRGYADKEILQSGSGLISEKNKELYDRFRNRIIFPINDSQGNIVGFGGRIFADDKARLEEAKYVNSPQTAVYNKSLILYGLDKAKLEIKKKDYVVIVEGYMDLISAYQAGTNNIVASSGTALTLDQLKILKRLTNNLMMGFDMDEAGWQASQRGIDLALRQEFNVKVIQLKNFKDPAECIRQAKDQWFQAIKDAQHFVDFYFDKILQQLDLTRPDHKKKAASLLLALISRLPNLIEQTHYLQKLSKVINVPEDVLKEILNKKLIQQKNNLPPAPAAIKLIDKKQVVSQRLLALVLKFPAYLKILIDNMEPGVLNQTIYQDLYKIMVNYYNLNQQFLTKNFLDSLTEPTLISEANTLSLLADSEFEDWPEPQIHSEIINNLNYLKKEYYSQRLAAIIEAIRISQQEKNEEQLKILTEEFDHLSKELKNL